jgi:hypothetical protein
MICVRDVGNAKEGVGRLILFNLWPTVVLALK